MKRVAASGVLAAKVMALARVLGRHDDLKVAEDGLGDTMHTSSVSERARTKFAFALRARHRNPRGFQARARGKSSPRLSAGRLATVEARGML